MLLAYRYQISLNGVSLATALIFAFCASIGALGCMTVAWLAPLSILVLGAAWFTSMALSLFYFAFALARRIRRGPSLAHSDGAVSVAYLRLPINVNTLFFCTCLSMFPFALIGCALERTSTFSSGLTALLLALDAVTIVSASIITVIAVVVRSRSAYKPSKIHGGPILTFTPTYLEFHPLPSPTPIRIPWDHAPSITAIDYPTVRADVIQRAHIMTTASPAPTLIDITCLDWTQDQLQRTIGYFVCNPERRGILATAGGVDVVRALLRGQDPDA
ncbi:hypothetical protein O3654_05790 [Pauljensenia sp. 20925_1_91]